MIGAHELEIDFERNIGEIRQGFKIWVEKPVRAPNADRLNTISLVSELFDLVV